MEKRPAFRCVSLTLTLTLALAACGGAGTGDDDGTPDAAPDPGLAVLGGGSHSLDAVVLTEVANSGDGLRYPRDLAFKPDASELWIVNGGDDSTTVVFAVDTATQSSSKFRSAGGEHFMSRVAALAFGAPGTFATIQDQDQETQPSTPADFMGPTLWSSNLSIFDAGHGGHLDMLHNSPNSTGIAWDRDNAYWVFDGYHSSITRYDFHADHGPGGTDHEDGEIARYVEGEVKYDPAVSSHMELDHATGLLYIADTGNGRIAVLDTGTGSRGASLSPNYDAADMYWMVDASISTLVDESSAPIRKPSGLALRDDILYVTDNAASTVLAFDLAGELIDWVQLTPEIPTGSLMGIEPGSDGSLYLVDSANDRVLRLAAKPVEEDPQP
jgi:DNA-binding beta-propeller fold protein YncE